MSDFMSIVKEKVSEQGFIKSPYSFLYDIDEIELDSFVLRESLSIVVEHNKSILNDIKVENKELEELINIKVATSEKVEKREVESIVEKENKVSMVNLDDEIEILYHTPEEELCTILSNIDKKNYNRLKLSILLKIKRIEEKIRGLIISNPSINISTYQKDILIYKNVLNSINSLSDNVESDNDIESTKMRKVIFVPDKKNSTYIYNDICKYLDNSKEIKLVIDKLINGYFLSSKDVRTIVDKSEKLYEYKHPNGLRIMFIKLPNDYIAVTNLFYKDKQKSIKIDLYYDEAINRYRSKKDYILSSLDNIDFHIEQAELIGEIYDLLDCSKAISLRKVGG